MKRTIVNVIEGLRRAFNEILGDSLGVSAKDAVVFHLRMRLGRDPFKVLWENLVAFYTELERIFGGGAKFLVKLTANDKGLLAEWHKLLEGIFGADS
jgi:hypothetical protein